MNTKTLTLLTLIAFAISSCTVFQYAPVSDADRQSRYNAQLPKERKGEDGKCYAKTLAEDQYDEYFKDYAVYTGDESQEEVDIEFVELVVKPGSTKWVKKKADRNCLSDDPNDCLVWCLVETPPETKEFKVLVDTTQSQNYEIQTVRYEELAKKGGHTVWTAVLCQGDITPGIMSQIQNALVAEEFLTEQSEAVMNSQTKAALTKYQRDNNLPVGQLDFKTLEALGVEL